MAERAGIDLKGGALRIGVFGAEPWSETMRKELEARLGIAAIDIYGLSEILGLGVASECFAARAGLHGWEDDFPFEVIDPESGTKVPPGTGGERRDAAQPRRGGPPPRQIADRHHLRGRHQGAGGDAPLGRQGGARPRPAQALSRDHSAAVSTPRRFGLSSRKASGPTATPAPSTAKAVPQPTTLVPPM